MLRGLVLQMGPGKDLHIGVEFRYVNIVKISGLRKRIRELVRVRSNSGRMFFDVFVPLGRMKT